MRSLLLVLSVRDFSNMKDGQYNMDKLSAGEKNLLERHFAPCERRETVNESS